MFLVRLRHASSDEVRSQHKSDPDPQTETEHEPETER